MSEVQDNKKIDLKKELVALTTEHWEKTKKVLLLATLGQELMKRGVNLKAELRGQKFIPFLLTELKDQLTVLKSPFAALVYGVVPAVHGTKDPKTLFSATTTGASDRVNFDRRIWMAFSRPLEPNHVRLIELEPEIRVEDVPAAAAKESKKLRIGAELIIPAGQVPSDERNVGIQKNIRDWFAQNKQDMEIARAKSVDTRASEGTLLAALMRALEKRDWERLSLPLDIVAKLLAHRIKRD